LDRQVKFSVLNNQDGNSIMGSEGSYMGSTASDDSSASSFRPRRNTGEALALKFSGTRGSLDSFGNNSFKLLDEWAQLDKVTRHAKNGKKKYSVRNMQMIKAATARTQSFLTEEDDDEEHGLCVNVILNPISMKRAAWDVFSLFLVTYDMASLPLQFFDPEPNIFTEFMGWFTRLFWTIDISVSFITGFLYRDGSFEMTPKVVFYHYFRRMFFFDMSLVAIDWAEVFITAGASSAGDVGRGMKMSRTLRILRLLRLLRIARLQKILKAFSMRFHSERVEILVDIAKIMFIIIAVAHVMACFWYGIGGMGDNSWMIEERVFEKTLAHRYLISLHWSLCQFQGGMDEFRAGNLKERLYNTVMCLMSFMMAAVCISDLTSSMTRLHILSSQQSRQLVILRRYLLQNGISDKLSLRVQRNVLHAINEQQRMMQETQVDLMKVVSEPLRVELHFEMYAPVLEILVPQML
jgi:hypothetical protein